MSNESDRELLELAAKAAGVAYDPEHSKPHPISGAWWGLWLKYDREPHEFDRRYWTPLTDDGDALRLAVKLRIFVEFSDTLRMVNAGERLVEYGQDIFAATRRAIVRAAAEIGKTMNGDT